MADVKFTDLPAASLPLVGNEIFAAVQGGVSVNLTADDVAALADNGIQDAPVDGELYGRKDGDWEVVPAGGGGVQSVVAGTGISVDNTDPENPIVSAAGGASDVLDVSTPTNSSGTVTLDFAGKTRYVGTVTLGANVTTLAFANLPGAGKFAEYELHIAQDGTGSRTFAIPASHRALGGSDTAIASAANTVTVLTASTVDNGTTWRYAMQESA